jgi:hypothetical protein
LTLKTKAPYDEENFKGADMKRGLLAMVMVVGLCE